MQSVMCGAVGRWRSNGAAANEFNAKWKTNFLVDFFFLRNWSVHNVHIRKFPTIQELSVRAQKRYTAAASVQVFVVEKTPNTVRAALTSPKYDISFDIQMRLFRDIL